MPTQVEQPADRSDFIEGRVRRQRDALVRLSQLQLASCEALPELLGQILEVAAQTLGVTRVSVWRFDDQRSVIHCVDRYDAAAGTHDSIGSLRAADFPRYFKAITSSDVVAVEDAELDPRTSEFAVPYLQPMDIKSEMDAPLYLRGVVVGVLSHEQTRVPRWWTADERAFAIAVANVISLAFERCERHRVESTVVLQAAALNAASHAIVITDRQARIVWANPAFTTLTGYPLSEAIGHRPGELVKSGAQDAAFYEAMWTALSEGRQWRSEITNRRKDGTTYLEDLTITPVRDEGGAITHFVGIKVDLTERRRLEELFLQSQKMEVVGRLAGGVAHDFNNLLTVINGTAELALMDMQADAPLRADLEEIRNAGEHAASLTRQLLAFSRKGTAVREQFDPGVIVAELRGMLRRLIGEDVRLEVAVSTEGATIVADRSHFGQVVLNLVVNARDAMPSGGALSVDVRTVMLDADRSAIPSHLQRGPHVRLAVTDTGEGIAPETITRIFEPYFTTKEAAKGTGLGLATVYAVVEECGGAIAVESEVGTGTTFEVLFPCTANGAAPSPQPIAGFATNSGGIASAVLSQ